MHVARATPLVYSLCVLRATFNIQHGACDVYVQISTLFVLRVT